MRKEKYTACAHGNKGDYSSKDYRSNMQCCHNKGSFDHTVKNNVYASVLITESFPKVEERKGNQITNGYTREEYGE